MDTWAMLRSLLCYKVRLLRVKVKSNIMSFTCTQAQRLCLGAQSLSNKDKEVRLSPRATAEQYWKQICHEVVNKIKKWK